MNKKELLDRFKNSKHRRCPKCKSEETYVRDVRNFWSKQGVTHDSTKRRRACKKCQHRWSTHEIHQDFYRTINKVVKLAEAEAKKSAERAKRGSVEQAGVREALQETVRKIEGRSKG